MAISIKNRDVVNFNAPSSTGKPKADQYLDFNDDSGETVASLFVPASGATPTFTVDNAPVGGVQTVYASAPVVLHNADILALGTGPTPFQLLAAQGANTVISVKEIIGILDNTAGAYTNTATFAINGQIGGWGVTTGFEEDDQAAFQDNSGVKLLRFQPNLSSTRQATWWSNVGDAANQPLLLAANGQALLTGGHANNTLTLITYYSVLPV